MCTAAVSSSLLHTAPMRICHVPQAATSQLNGNTHAAAEARLRDAEAAAAQREADLKRERDALAAKCAALQSQIADLQAQLRAAKVAPCPHACSRSFSCATPPNTRMSIKSLCIEKGLLQAQDGLGTQGPE